jgi:hypothetical protein
VIKPARLDKAAQSETPNQLSSRKPDHPLGIAERAIPVLVDST